MEKKIFEELNRAYQRATKDCEGREIDGLFLPNLMFFCDTEVEKANVVIETWAKEKNVNFLAVDGNDQSVIKKAAKCVTIGNFTKNYIAPTKDQIEKLNQPNTILFLKNLHKMEDKIYRRWLFDFMNELIVADDSKEEGYVFVKNMLFVVGTAGEMSSKDIFEMCTMDAKDAFAHINLDR